MVRTTPSYPGVSGSTITGGSVSGGSVTSTAVIRAMGTSLTVPAISKINQGAVLGRVLGLAKLGTLPGAALTLAQYLGELGLTKSDTGQYQKPPVKTDDYPDEYDYVWQWSSYCKNPTSVASVCTCAAKRIESADGVTGLSGEVSGTQCRIMRQGYPYRNLEITISREKVNDPSQCESGYTYTMGKCSRPKAPNEELTDQDIDDLKNKPGALPIPDDALKELQSIPVPLDIDPPQVAPGTYPVGPPYTAPDGTKRQPEVTISPNADGTANLSLADKPVTESGEQAGPPQEVTDPCRERPDTVGCQELGDVPEQDIKTANIDIKFSPGTNPLPGGTCPPPLSVRGGYISFEAACSAFEQLRPVVLALSLFLSLFIVTGAFREAS
jgi:hypothetical protein